ncbi:phenylalanine--tRNA ligase beta subunit-related protein [Streptomyces sp. NPDC051776]|uniref:B3/B4 domain-containing protein n=1 Tax=Streptomyces sp. NPDC051776 TaxID=3155414 RepID=UPI003412866D
MRFRHTDALWSGFPELSAGALCAEGGAACDAEAADTLAARVAAHTARATARLDGAPESEFPEVRAWRRAFARMGLRPTQYRCASEALLRRLRKEASLPRIDPVVDLCNAISAAYGIPVAVLDVERVAGPSLVVRHARGDEHYTPFGGGTEHPAPGEVIFADSAARAHARRWTNRQSAHSAVSGRTGRVLVVAEAMHDGGADAVPELLATVAHELGAHGWTASEPSVLTSAAPACVLTTPSVSGAPAP